MDKLLFNDYRHLDHLKIAEKQIPRGKNVELHYHDHAFSEVALITQADQNVLHWANSRSSHLSRGDVIVIHPNTVHAYEHTQGLAMENLLYNANQLPIPQMDGGNLNLFDTFLNPDSPRNFSPELPVVHLPEKQMKEAESLRAFSFILLSNYPSRFFQETTGNFRLFTYVQVCSRFHSLNIRSFLHGF